MFNEKLGHVLGRGFVVWLVIILIETIHGATRRIFLEPLVGDTRAKQIGVLIGSFVIIAVTFIFVRWLKASQASQFLVVGLLWVALTLAFELILGRLVLRPPWDRIASDYDPEQGGLMIVGLLVMLFAPVALAKLFDEI